VEVPAFYAARRTPAVFELSKDRNLLFASIVILMILFNDAHDP